MARSAQDFTMSTICSEKEEIKAVYNRLPAGKVRGKGTQHPKGCTGNNRKPNQETWLTKAAKLLEKIQEARLKIGTEGKWGEKELKNKMRKKSFKTQKDHLGRVAWGWKSLAVATPPAFQAGIHLCGPQKRQPSTPPLLQQQHSLPPVLTLCMNVQLCGELNSEAIHLQTNTLWRPGLWFRL